MDYKNDLQIDEHSLNREWKRQPFLYMQYSEELAKAGRGLQKAKENLDVVKAELDTKHRRMLDSEGEKITEARVSARIQTDPNYQEANKEYRDAEYEYNILNAAVKAFDHRKKALEKLVDLYLGGYYSSPRNKEVDETISSEASQGQRTRLNRRKNASTD